MEIIVTAILGVLLIALNVINFLDFNNAELVFKSLYLQFLLILVAVVVFVIRDLAFNS